MSRIPPARLNDRPLHSRSASTVSSLTISGSTHNCYHANRHNNTTAREIRSTESINEKKYVKWRVAWQPPTLMILYLVGGTILAIAHHVYFQSLHGTPAGSSTKQQWATGFGTAISFLVVALLRAGTCAAYGQYVWSLVRKRGFCLSTLDKLFALTTDPFGFWGVEMWKKAKIALLVAFVCWITPLAGIAPPATLSVVSGLVVESSLTPMKFLDWNSPSFYDIQPDFTLPSSTVFGIASRAALGSEILAFTPPESNSTFTVQFYGPAVKCSPANNTQQKMLDYYTKITQQQHSFVTKDSLAQDIRNTSQFIPGIGPTISSYNLLVFSAFAPFAGSQGWMYQQSKADAVDSFNNWNVDLPWDMDDLGYTVDSALYDDITQKLFVQTSTTGFVCLMGNASYDVDYEFVDGIQTVVRYSTSDFHSIEMMRSGGGAAGGAMQNPIIPGPYTRKSHTGFELSYMAVWQSFTSLISGNVTFGYVPLANPGGQGGVNNLTMKDISSRILLNGLSACDEITHSYWENLPFTLPNETESPAIFFNVSNLDNLETPNHILDKPNSLCRNRTLARAIEDLAGNITISMLSSAILTSPVLKPVNVTSQRTRNIYQYDSRNLIISYSAAIALTILGACFGIFAIFENGVAHSSTFSAIIATTRNTHLDELSRGNSLGAVAFDESVSSVRLKFGELLVGGKEEESGSSVVKRVGFGFEDEVGNLKKGGEYV